MRVYDPLMKYLDECGLQTVTLTYPEIEKIIDRELPATAYKKTRMVVQQRSDSFPKCCLV